MTTRALLAGLASLILAAGCATLPGSSDCEVPMEVRNDNARHITVYADRGGSRFKVGKVRAATVDTLAVPCENLRGLNHWLLTPEGATHAVELGWSDRPMQWETYQYRLRGLKGNSEWGLRMEISAWLYKSQVYPCPTCSLDN